jgi:peroxiredoxin
LAAVLSPHPDRVPPFLGKARIVDDPCLATFTAKRHIAYTLLSDPKSEVIDEYKLRDPEYPPGNRASGVPRPIIFVLDTGGVIKAKLYEETFKLRPPVIAVISKLDELGGRS